MGDILNYVVSDIHGYYKRFLELLEKINFSEKDTMYILGDIIDRGPEIAELVEFVVNTPNIKMILGNHEDMFLTYYDTKSYDDKELWYYNGGAVTDMAFSKLPKEKVKNYINYFEGLPIELEIEVNNQKYLLVHGNYVTDREKKYLSPFEYRFQVIWSRVSKRDKGPKDKIVIFGHTPTHKYMGNEKPFTIWKNGNIIGIDCGMAKIARYGDKSRIGCLCLDTMEEIYV